jgi:hypothetical protein
MPIRQAPAAPRHLVNCIDSKPIVSSQHLFLSTVFWLRWLVARYPRRHHSSEL